MKETPQFVDDLSVPGMLHGILIRSPCSAGRLLDLEVPRLPHGYSIIKASDIPGKNFLDGFSPTVPLLAQDRVTYTGEPVAVLLGPDVTKLQQYADACVVKVQEEAPQFSCEKFSSDRLVAKRAFTIGDPDGIFEKATLIVEGTYRTGLQEHWYPEPHGALATFSYDKMVITLGTQWPFQVRRSVAAALGVSPEDVVIRPSEMGINFDGKLWYPALIACYAALGALFTKHSVKIMFTRDEDFRFSPKRNGSRISIKTAIGKNGEIEAIETRTILDLGAGSPFAEEILDRSCVGSLGLYRCENLRVEGFAVRTNTPPSGPFAGLGLSQSLFAIERHASRIAQKLSLDGGVWRQEQAVKKGDRLPSGAVLKDPVPVQDLLETVESMSDYRRKWSSYELLRSTGENKRLSPKRGPFRGIGVSIAFQGNGFISFGSDRGNYSVELTMEKDGKLEIRTSAVVSSPETLQIWARSAAELLGIDEEGVRFAPNQTDTVPDSGPSSLSRNITVITKLIERSCVELRKLRFREPLPITVRRAYRAPKATVWNGTVLDGSPFSKLSWGASVVEVEIDPIDFNPLIRGVWLAVDGGRILSDKKARSSLKISTLHALGWASRESLSYTNGEISSMDVLSYDFLPLQSAPPIVIDFSWNDSSVPKGIGELPFACVPAAYAQALSQAADFSFDTLPITMRSVRGAFTGEEKNR